MYSTSYTCEHSECSQIHYNEGICDRSDDLFDRDYKEGFCLIC